MRWQDHIDSRPEVMSGKPVVRGTRITVQHLLERLGDGWSESDILHAHPHVKPIHIRAALAYAASALASGRAGVSSRTSLMRLLADENLDVGWVAWLREQGHDVLSILETARSADDPSIVAIAREQQRIILTCDLDFGEQVYRFGRATAGVLLLRLRAASRDELQHRFRMIWPEVADHLPGHFVVAANGSIRIRNFPTLD